MMQRNNSVVSTYDTKYFYTIFYYINLFLWRLI